MKTMENNFNEKEITKILEIIDFQFQYQKKRNGHLALIPKLKNNKELEVKDLKRLEKILKDEIKYIKKITMNNKAITNCENEINLYKKTLIKLIEKLPIKNIIKISNKLTKK